MVNTLTNQNNVLSKGGKCHDTEQRTKKSRQKEAILKVLGNTLSHPTAMWIYDEVRREIPNISLGTVYRNLRLLAARGEISELEIDKGIRRFSADTRNHHHGKCDRCGGIFDIDDSASRVLERQISRLGDFQISEYRVEFHGLCRKYQES